MKSLTLFVIGCLLFVILYIVASIVIRCTMGIQLSDSLTTGVFGLFGTELAVSGFIKIFKIRQGE